MYITDETCSRWVEYGGGGRRKPPNGLLKQSPRGCDTLDDLWKFVREISSAHPDVTERLEEYHTLYSIKQIPFTGEFRPDLRNTRADNGSSPEVDLFVGIRDVKSCMRPTRPGQQEFRKAVMDRYGAHCAFCRIGHEALLDAAHIVPWNRMGADHPENALVLCKLHHFAFDEGLVYINPSTLQLHYVTSGPHAADLHIERPSIEHLPQLPWTRALQDLWDRRI
jgi:hypothetical protein